MFTTAVHGLIACASASGASLGSAAWKACAEFGVLGMPVPTEHGGMGLGLSDLLAVMEGLGEGTRDQGLLFSLNAHLWTNTIPILHYGDDAQTRDARR